MPGARYPARRGSGTTGLERSADDDPGAVGSRGGASDPWLLCALAVALAYAVTFAALAVQKHLTFHSNAYDLGLQHQVVWNTWHGRPFQYTYMVAFNPRMASHLGDHVNLILLPIAALYGLHDGPATLLVVQAVAVASGLVPLFAIARRLLGSGGAALALASLYLLHPATQAALLFDFHPIVLAAPLFLWAYLFAHAHRPIALGVATLALLATQENAALVVASLGVLLFLQGQRRAGSALLAAGVGWFALCFFVILPHFNPGTGSNAFARYRAFGDTWWQVALQLVLHPGDLLSHALAPDSRSYLWSLFAPFGFLSLLAPEILIAAASELLLNLLSDFPLQRTIDYQYASVIVAVLALAAVVGAARAVRLVRAVSPVPARAARLVPAAWGLVAMLAFQVARYGNLRALGPEYAGVFTMTQHARLGRQVLAQIPPDAPVAAQGTIAPHVSNRRTVYVFPTVRDAEFVVLDERAGIFPVQLQMLPGMTAEESYREYVQRLLRDGEFAVVVQADGWWLLRRERPRSE